jgi:hypothetical protein
MGDDHDGEDEIQSEGAGQDTYLKLVAIFPLASIKSDEQLHDAQ